MPFHTCPDCPFGGARVGTRGDSASPIMFVGESPGHQELKKGIPFIGESGKVLMSAVPKGIDGYFSNAMSCNPHKKDAAIMKKACNACHDRLLNEITAHPRKVIVALGNPAMHTLTGNFELKITQERGRLISSELAEHGIMPAVHPAALMKGTGSYKKFKRDIAYACDLSMGGARLQPKVPQHHVVNEPYQVKILIEFLRRYPELVGDIETGGLNRQEDDILCLGITFAPDTCVMVPEHLLHLLKPLFEPGGPKWIWQNGKFDIAFLRREGLNAVVDEDTMLLSYCLDEVPGHHDLEQLASDLLGAPDYKHMIKPYLPKKDSSYALIPKPVLYEYGTFDCANTFGIFPILRERVRSDELSERLYTKTLIPASEMLYHVEKRGIQVDLVQLEENDKRLEADFEKAVGELAEIAGWNVNPNSWQQVGKLLFDQLHLPSKYRNTRKETLDLMRPHPAIRAIKACRKAGKARSTYVTSIRNRLQGENRVHTTFNIHGTRTGRLSSKQPNVQNIPRDHLIRGQFVAPENYCYIETDLNQAELRSLACLSNDTAMCEIYRSEHMSIHDEMSIFLFGENWTAEEKMRAKAVNFGIVYGREPPSLAEEFKTHVSETQRWVAGWFERFPEAHEFIKMCRAAPLKMQTLITVFGRKKRFELVTRKNLKGLQNEAANFPHQSIASDINVHTAIIVRPILESWGVYIVNLVHDSILMECPMNLELINRVRKLVEETMEAVPLEWGINRVPFKADSKVGYRWGSCPKEMLGEKNVKGYLEEIKNDTLPAWLIKDLNNGSVGRRAFV